MNDSQGMSSAVCAATPASSFYAVFGPSGGLCRETTTESTSFNYRCANSTELSRKILSAVQDMIFSDLRQVFCTEYV